jgi:hypothetical protein
MKNELSEEIWWGYSNKRLVGSPLLSKNMPSVKPSVRDETRKNFSPSTAIIGWASETPATWEIATRGFMVA